MSVDVICGLDRATGQNPEVEVRASDGAVRVVLGNPSASALGSVTATMVSTPLGSATAFTGGIYVWNADTTLAVYVGFGPISADAGQNKICLGPGQGILLAVADLSLLQIIAASGGPVVSWQGLTA